MLLEGGISVLKRLSVYYFGNWLLSGEQTWFLREKISNGGKNSRKCGIVATPGKAAQTQPPAFGRIQELAGSSCFSSLPQPPLPHVLGNDFSSDPLIPAQDSSSVPSQAGSTRKLLQHSKEQFWSGSINPFVGTHGGSCSSVEMGFSCLSLG